MKTEALQPAATTLIFTPTLVREFGNGSVLGGAADAAIGAYTHALQTSFQPTASEICT